MNIHPVQAVGVLPDFHLDVSAPIPLDYDMDHVPANGPTHADAFPNDPLHASLTTSLVSSESASVEGNPFENTHQLDDHLLDNMIARFLDSDADAFTTEVDMVSVDEITFNAAPQGESQVLLGENEFILSAGYTSPRISHPQLDRDASKGGIGSNLTQRRKKRGMKKGKRSRAPARPWTEDEHQRFEESLELFGRNWEQCAAYIGTRRAQLVRSHAQKHLIKLWKLGKPLPKKVAESGTGYTLSGKPLLADSASARSYLTKIPCPDICEKSK